MSSELLRKYIDLFEEQKPYRVDVSGYNLPAPTYAVFIGDSIAFGLSSEMMTNTRTDAAVGLSSNAIANRVARNEKVQKAVWAIVSAGTNDFATDQGNPTALESNLALIRTGLKARQYVWLGPYNEQANAVVKKFALSKGDTFIDLRTFPPDRLGIHPARYSDVMISIRKQTKLGSTDPNYDHSWNYGTEDPKDSPALLPPSNKAAAPAPAGGTAAPAPAPAPAPAGGTAAPPVAGTQTTTKPLAPANTDPVEKTEPPKDIKQYKDKVKKLKIDFQTKFDRSLPITSEERTRAEQQSLYNRWLKKEPGIYIPINPDNHPGREIFHNTAIDVSPALSRDEEAWMKEQGWVRTIPEKDPPHYEYKGKWDETPAPAPTVTPTQEKPVTPLIKPEVIDRLDDILKKLPKKESHDKLSMLKNINQRSPQEQMQLWQAVVIAEAPDRIDPTFEPTLEPTLDSDGPATPSQPKARIIPAGAKFAVVAPNGQRFGGFDSQRAAMEWIAEPKNYRMLYPNSTNWIGGTPPAPSGLRPLSGYDKFKRIMNTPGGKGAKAGAMAAALAGTAYSVYDNFRDIDLSDLPPESQRYVKSIMPSLKTFYKDPEKYAKDYSPEQIKKLKNNIIQLKQRSGGNNVFPPSDVWDAWMKTQPNTQ